jgi:uncharacterized membrane protein
MLEGMITLVYYGLGAGGSFGNFLAQLEQMGFFSYVLPLLLIFILVYAILDKTQIFGEGKKGINAVLAIAVSFLSLQFNFVSYFFAEIFPRMGILLSVLVVVLVVLGLFFDFNKENGNPRKVFGWIFGIALLVVVFQSVKGYLGFGTFGYGSNIGYLLRNHFATIFIVALVIVVIIALFVKKPQTKTV